MRRFDLRVRRWFEGRLTVCVVWVRGLICLRWLLLGRSCVLAVWLLRLGGPGGLLLLILPAFCHFKSTDCN